MSMIEILEALEPRVCLSISFATPITTALGEQQLAVAGDMNGDGRADLVARGSDGKVRIFHGLGDGKFSMTPAHTLNAGINVTGVALGDFNRDGRLDFACSNSAGVLAVIANASVFLNNGNGGFSGPNFVYAGNDSRAIATTDFNRDGKLDLFVANGAPWTQTSAAQAGYGAAYLVGRGDGTFINAQRIPLLGPQDLVAVPLGQNSTAAAPANIGVAFGGENTSAASPIPVAMIYTVRYAFTNALPVHSFSPFIGRISGLAVGDLNRDGQLDLAAEQTFATNASFGDASVHTYLAQNNGTFTEKSNVQTVLIHAAGLSLADLDRDGRLDVVVTGEDARPLDIPGPPGMLIALRGNGDGTLGPARSVRTFPVPTSQWLADLNRDGFIDVVTANEEGVTSLLNTSRPTTTNPVLIQIPDSALDRLLEEVL